MTKRSSPTAGIGDPYWYEWSVGLLYVLDMLDPTSGIASVTLQSTHAKGLDDVVVVYNDNESKCLQIKHTRVEDTLTFGDMIEVSGNGESLLSAICNAWVHAAGKWQICEPIIYTNRIVGSVNSQATGPKGIKYTRPALKDFLENIQEQAMTISAVSEIQVPDEWATAWEIWCDQLKGISSPQQKIEFLQIFRIETDQPSLEELSDKLVRILGVRFGVTQDNAQSLLQALDHALRKWVTTRRTREEITVEDLFDALRIPQRIEQGQHDLPTPSPFFPSREKLLSELSSEILHGTFPVIFLTGDPGIGKTSVVSALTNHHEPFIDLRYHAFRPITPQDEILPADTGEATKPERLWGDLLSQLRVLLKGKMAKYEVPVRNEFLTVNQMREHVMRLSQTLANERGRPTVIAIDGIDHAARSRSDKYSFLDSLIQPDAIPNGVKFVIAGQPAHAYPKYPSWLRTQSDKVRVWEVGGIQLQDIRTLLDNSSTGIPTDELVAAARLIDNIAQGNTLSAIFAAYESTQCSNVHDLQQRLKRHRLRDGIIEYYDQIWNSAKDSLPSSVPDADFRIAACFALLRGRLTGQMLADIFTDMPSVTVSHWSEFLRMLRPLVTDDENGFRVTHNDVRVYLTKRVSSEESRLKPVASQIANYCLSGSSNPVFRHSDLFHLLQISDRLKDIPKSFTVEFVIEGYALQRPISELVEHCKQALSHLELTRDWNCVHSVSRATATLLQLQKSIEWANIMEYSVWELPPVLYSEGYVHVKSGWTLGIVKDTLSDAMRLIDSNELNRARGLMQRWFSGLTPNSMYELLKDDEKFFEPAGYMDSHLSDSVASVFELWGRISQHVGMLFEVKNTDMDDLQRQCTALFFGGFLTEAVSIGGIKRWIRAFDESIQHPLSRHVLIDCLINLSASRRWKEIVYVLEQIEPRESPSSFEFNIFATALALLTTRTELAEKWSKSVSKIEFLSTFPYQEDEVWQFVYRSFVLGGTQSHLESGDISQMAVKNLDKHEPERNRPVAMICNAAAFIGRWMRLLNQQGPETVKNLLLPKQFSQVLDALERVIHQKVHLTGHMQSVVVKLIEVMMELSALVGSGIDKEMYHFVRSYVESKMPINLMLEPCWKYLMDRGEYDLLEDWFNHWLGPSGAVWSKEIADRIDVVNRFTTVAHSTHQDEVLEQIHEKMRWATVSYTGHKEYTLESPLNWYQSLAKFKPASWRREGTRLLSISQEISRIGDNRLSQDVEAAVCESVVRCGVSDLELLMSAHGLDSPVYENPTMLFDGIIASLETLNLDQQELESLWGLAIGMFRWQVEYDRGYLQDIKEVIFEVAKREGIDISERLRAIGPAEFSGSVDREMVRLPRRWLSQNDQPEKMPNQPIDEMVRTLEKQEKSGSLWRAIGECARRLENERPRGFQDYLNRLIKVVYERPYDYAWTFDSVNHAYEWLVPLCTETCQWDMLKRLVRGLDFDNDRDIWMNSVATNLDLLCLYRAKGKGQEELEKGLERLLDMHECWIEGNGNLPKMLKVQIADVDFQAHSIMSYAQFGAKLLTQIFNTGSASFAEAALRGAWSLAARSRDAAKEIADAWSLLRHKGQEWILLIAERMAREKHPHFKVFEDIVLTCYSSDDLRLKLQAWVILQAYEVSTGKTCPAWQMKPHHNHELLQENRSLAGGHGVLKVSGDHQGSIGYSLGLSAIHSTLQYLSAVTEDDVRDIEDKYAVYVLKNPVMESPTRLKKRTGLYGDSEVPESLELMRLNDVIYDQLSIGRWSDIPHIRLAQALTLSDDPFVLLSSPVPASALEKWVIDHELNALFGERKVLEQTLQQSVIAGCSDTEVVVGATLITYTGKHDVELRFSTVCYPASGIPDKCFTTTLNGRTFGLYDDNAFEPFIYDNCAEMVYFAGGSGNFVHQSMLVYQSSIWKTDFEWELNRFDPTKWLYHGKEIARFERYHGPLRDTRHEMYHRQPILQRWVVSKEALDKALTKNDFLIEPFSNLQIYQYAK